MLLCIVLWVSSSVVVLPFWFDELFWPDCSFSRQVVRIWSRRRASALEPLEAGRLLWITPVLVIYQF